MACLEAALCLGIVLIGKEGLIFSQLEEVIVSWRLSVCTLKQHLRWFRGLHELACFLLCFRQLGLSNFNHYVKK